MVNTKIRLIILFAAKDGETLQLAKTRLGDDCASDHELLWLMGNEYLDDFLNYTLHRKFKF